MSGFTDDELFGSPQAQPTRQRSQGGFSDDELFGAPQTSMWQAPEELAKRLVRGVKDTIGTTLQGVAEAIPPDEGNAKRARSGQLIREGVPYEEAIRRAEEEFASGALQVQRPQDTAFYQAGTEFKRTELTKPAPGWESSVLGDIAGAFGSVAANIGPAMFGSIGRGIAKAGLPFGGSGEAAERARTAGAPEDTVRQAAQAGGLAGATDLADFALLRAGVGGAMASRARRALTRLIEGGLIEGSQEGVQQFIQNAIAQGLYKPEQDLSEEVLYNMFLGAVVGGSVKAAVAPNAPAPPPSPADVDALVASMNAGGPAAPPPATAPTATASPQDPVDAALGVISGLQEPPPSAAPTGGVRRVYPPGVELRNEDGMWNVYVDGGLDNAFGARSDADNYIRNFAGLSAAPADPTETPTYLPPKAAPPPANQVDPEVGAFLAKKVPPLKAEEMLPAREEVQSKPGANLGRLAALLGPKLYGSPADIATVSVKEIVQNSFDAIKAMIERGQIAKGRLDIVMDNKSRTLTISDNGSGMSPDILGTKFLEIAGTSKESERSSGGLGIAKMLFLFGNQNLEVVTLRDNKVSVLRTTGKDLFAALEDPKKAPKITIRAPTREDRVLFPEGHGSVVRVKIPESFVDPSTGETKSIEFPYWGPSSHNVLKNSPLFTDIDVTFNGSPVENMGTKFPMQDYTQFANLKTSWGMVHVYVTKEQDPSIWHRNVHVLSNGLWQFSFKLSKNPSDPYGDAIPRNFYLDLSPKVRPEDPGYPFDLNRQQFSPQAKKDFEQLFHYISLAYQKLDFVESMQNFGDIQYLTSDASGVKAGPKQKLQPIVPPSATAASAVNIGDQGEIVDGKLIINGRKIPELTPKDLKEYEIDYDELKIPQDQVDTSLPILHDNVDVKISDLEVLSISDLMRQKFGTRFDEFAYGLGQAFVDLRDIVADIAVGEKIEQVPSLRDKLGLAPFGKKVPDKPWIGLKKEGVGISFDNQYRGVSIRVPFSASLLNIAVPEYSDTLRAAVGMVGTMVHELAHHRVRSHNAEFPAEMQRILIHLDVHPSFNFFAFKQRVVDIVQQHRDVFEYLNGVMTSGTFPVQPRGKRFQESSDEQTGDGGDARNVGAVGFGTEGPIRIPRGVETGSVTLGSKPGRPELSVQLQASGPDPRVAQSADQRRLNRAASDGNGATATGRSWSPGTEGPDASTPEPEIAAIEQRIDTLFQAAGGTPASVRVSAGHARRINRWYKVMAGLDQLLKANPQFLPLRRYWNSIVQMHNEESKIQDAALRVLKEWRGLKEQSERLASMLDDLANMRYRTADEIRRGIERHPTAPELSALFTKHQIDANGARVYDKVRKMFDIFLDLVKGNAIDAANRIITDPVANAQKINEINAQIDSLKARPYFPLMRFGLHYVMKKDAAGRVVHFETFERRGIRSAESIQREAEKKLNASKATGEVIAAGKLPEGVSNFMSLPTTLLDTIKTSLNLTPDQINALEHIQLMSSPALNFKRMMKSDYIPGYSKDFQRAFARYFFHGGRHYARTKFGHQINSHIAVASQVPNNKANMIADYMRDHYQKTILDAKGDFGIFKGGIFIWALGYMPAAATMNMLQTPVVTYSHLAGKFGGFGLGNKRAIQAIGKAAADVRSYYKRQTYDSMTQFQFEALSYGIKTGRVSETQAPELAGISAGNNLLGTGGTKLDQAITTFLEKGAFMFEMAEQFNRRVAFRAALDLAQKFPNSKAVREATTLYSEEFAHLQTPGAIRPGHPGLTPAQAAAVVTAVHTVDQTQFIYARYARPKIMRGRLAGTVFVFKKYLQSMLFWMGQNKSDVLPQYLVVMALLGGLSGGPGYEDLRDLIRGFARWFFGKDFNLDKKARELVLALAGDKVDPDIVLHGLSRVGFGVPALLDLMGSVLTGTPGRGLTSQISHMPSDPTGRGANVPFPVIDRHRALSMGPLLGFSPGRLIAASGDSEMQRAIAEETQRASGAVFGLGFNIYKTLVSEKSWSDLKRYEGAVPRALGALSRSYRAFSEGRERGRGGPNAAPTIVPYDVRDTEQMMEAIFMGLGYQPLRQQARWDNIIAKAEAEKFWDGKRNGLLAQFDEAQVGGNQREIDKVTEAIAKFNEELPDFARGQTITADLVRRSIQQRQRTRTLRELGVPLQKRNFGISEHIDRLYREGAVDVRPVR